MRKNASYEMTDILHFPKGMEIVPFEDVYVALSVNTANWIVLYNGIQKDIFECLLKGKSIEDALSKCGEDSINDLKKVLMGIYARKLGSTGTAPTRITYSATEALNVYLTEACNLRCKTCFMSAGKPLKEELTYKQWADVLQQFKEAGGKEVTFTGGEPTMNKDFDEIIKHAHSLGLRICVLTNGTLWDNWRIDKLSNYIDEVQVSLDGVNEPNNAVIRGKGAFADAYCTIVRFANKGVKVTVATTFTLDNISTGFDYKSLVAHIKYDTDGDVSFHITKNLIPGREVNYSKKDNERLFDEVKEIEDYVNPNASLVNFIEGHELNSIMDDCGYGHVSIAANGNVFFCNRIKELQCYGNVKYKPLKDFIEEGRKLIAATSVDAVKPCKDCMLRYICGGGCRIDNFNFKGNLKGWKKDIERVGCDTDFKRELLRKMVDSYTYYYQLKN